MRYFSRNSQSLTVTFTRCNPYVALIFLTHQSLNQFELCAAANQDDQWQRSRPGILAKGQDDRPPEPATPWWKGDETGFSKGP